MMIFVFIMLVFQQDISPNDLFMLIIRSRKTIHEAGSFLKAFEVTIIWER